MADTAKPTSPTVVDIEALLNRLTLEEKISLLSGQDFWTLNAIKRVGISSLKMSDGPTGLRSTNSNPATVFPVAVALAATWDRNLIEQTAAAIGREALSHGVHVLLAPGINIQRTPLGGRNFEYYSEDPFLSAQMGIAFVDGVQSAGVGTSVKHFVANNQEHNRMSHSVNVNERVLREIYLAAFEPVIKQSNPWTVMCAYNRINGVFAAEHDEIINGVLKDEWGYDGVVVSDWGAAKSTIGSATGGLDLEMPGPAMYYADALKAAVQAGDVSVEHVDDHARRILRLLSRCGLLEGQTPQPAPDLATKTQRRFSKEAAADSMVLLKNEHDLLPLNRSKSIAIIGALADAPAIQGGGSSQVSPERIVTPLQGLKKVLPPDCELVFERGLDPEPNAPTMDGRLLSTGEGSNVQGLRAAYYEQPGFEGKASFEDTDWHLTKLGFGEEVQSDESLGFSVEWTGYFTPRYSGVHTFDVTHANPDVELSIGSKTLIGPDTTRHTEMLFMILPINKRPAQIELEAGKSYPIRIAYSQPHEGALRGFSIFNVGLREPEPDEAAALTAARLADQAVLFVGSGKTSETEGEDRPTMGLGEKQNAFINAVLDQNPDTVIVVNSGGPIEMPWADRARTILQMWLPGQEGGAAVAEILSGARAPSGKLPITLPKHYEDNPTFLHYPGGQEVDYGEGLFVGYRYYDKTGTPPLFPFGHGLTYTQFAYSDLIASRTNQIGEEVVVTVQIRNTGARAGAEIVQLYVENLATDEIMPAKELRAFDKTHLEAGAASTVKFTLSERSFAWYDRYGDGWTVTPGRYRLHVGASSTDIRSSIDIELSK